MNSDFLEVVQLWVTLGRKNHHKKKKNIKNPKAWILHRNMDSISHKTTRKLLSLLFLL